MNWATSLVQTTRSTTLAETIEMVAQQLSQEVDLPLWLMQVSALQTFNRTVMIILQQSAFRKCGKTFQQVLVNVVRKPTLITYLQLLMPAQIIPFQNQLPLF